MNARRGTVCLPVTRVMAGGYSRLTPSFNLANQVCVNGVLLHVHEMFSFPSKLLSLVARILEFGFRRWESWRLVGADIVLFRMNRVSRSNSAENKSYDAKREVSETVLSKVAKLPKQV